MKVSELMSSGLQIVTPDQTIQEAGRMMLEADVGILPVGTPDNLEGIITDRDIAVRALAEGRGPETPVREAMSTGQTIVCQEDDDVEDAAILMSDNQVRRIPVLDRNGRLVGMLSLGDLARSEDSSTAEAALVGAAQQGGQHNQSADGAAGGAM